MIISDILQAAFGVALSPVPIIAVILMLFTARAKSTSLAFLIGWVSGLLIAGGIFLVLADVSGISGGQTPSPILFWLKLVLGLYLLFRAYSKWKNRSKKGEVTETPKWMEGIESLSPGKALGLAVIFTAGNPKNLIFTVAATSSILEAGFVGAQAWLWLLLFVFLGSLSVGIPVFYYFFAGDSAEKTLTAWKDWLSANNDTLMMLLVLYFAIKLIGDGLGGLLGF